MSLPLPWGCFRCDKVQGWREIWDPFCAFCGSAADDDDVVSRRGGAEESFALLPLVKLGGSQLEKLPSDLLESRPGALV